MGEIRVGTSSWADQTLLRAGAFSIFTGHPTPVKMLPRDLRPATGPTRVRRRDLPEESYEELWRRFRAALEPLAAADRLGVVLLQFPPWLVCGAAARRRIVELARRCRPWRVAVELRHGSWFDGVAAAETVTFLADHELSMVCLDMPQGHPSSVPPIMIATAEPGLVRFHGHSAHWAGGGKEDRFRYAYSDGELRRWAGLLSDLAGTTGELHVLFNNCCEGQAQRDAGRLAALLGVTPATEPAEV